MHDYQPEVEACSEALATRKLTIAFAESASAGKLAYAFSQTQQSGQVLKGGLVCYDACIKEDLLKVPKLLIDTFTPESAEVTREMATGLQQIMNAEVVVSVTGLPTPGGSETPDKPVGTMFYCIWLAGQTHDYREVFEGSPGEVIDLTITHIARSVTRLLEQTGNT
ncbi:damage-inducible protein CinA [Pedobacter yulinensis]|uniref:Damage-inducible protein CinA n=2 Tax=Pedobacter yulinensis TaxID=2126353 RepID=A0A2T3HMW0_9SPHI|nr:damage-inducible protein CinA [Pedobacter yulinensis]